MLHGTGIFTFIYHKFLINLRNKGNIHWETREGPKAEAGVLIRICRQQNVRSVPKIPNLNHWGNKNPPMEWMTVHPRTTQGEWKPKSFSDCGRYVWGSLFCQVLILALRYGLGVFCSTLEIPISGGIFEKKQPETNIFLRRNHPFLHPDVASACCFCFPSACIFGRSWWRKMVLFEKPDPGGNEHVKRPHGLVVLRKPWS